VVSVPSAPSNDPGQPAVLPAPPASGSSPAAVPSTSDLSPAVPTSAPPAAGTGRKVTVQPGEDANAVAIRAGVPVADLLAANGNPVQLYAGQELAVPEPGAVNAAPTVPPSSAGRVEQGPAAPAVVIVPSSPTYDDPAIGSGGSFGGGQQIGQPAPPAPPVVPTYDDPAISSGGSFGAGQQVGDAPGGDAGGQGGEIPRYDDPAINSGGSFGGGQQVGQPSANP
jgi:LysM repeat protein